MMDTGDRVNQWWDCPDCGAETTVETDDATRECTECDWSVTIPDQETTA